MRLKFSRARTQLFSVLKCETWLVENRNRWLLARAGVNKLRSEPRVYEVSCYLRYCWPAAFAGGKHGGKFQNKMADARRRSCRSRKSKNAKISRTENDEEAQNCVICLDTVSCRGKLSVCEHWFCFSCIFEWSKVGSLSHWFESMLLVDRSPSRLVTVYRVEQQAIDSC